MLDAPIEGITVADQDIVLTEIITPDEDDSKADDDDDDEYIPLDPETVAEERELLEAELYNEQDLEEGVGFQDEELALDRRQKNAQEDERRREMREAIDDYEDELQQIVPGDSLLPDGGRGGAVRDASAHANGAPGSGALGHPPLPSLTESLSRLRAQLASLAAQRAEKRAELEVLDAERARIADRQAELQTRMDQAGLDYQLARVALDARRPVDRVADD